MFVNGGATFEIVVGEGHAGRMKVASIPSRQTLNDFEYARIYEWHRSAPASDSSIASNPCRNTVSCRCRTFAVVQLVCRRDSFLYEIAIVSFDGRAHSLTESEQ
jgi:hypothetical protein